MLVSSNDAIPNPQIDVLILENGSGDVGKPPEGGFYSRISVGSAPRVARRNAVSLAERVDDDPHGVAVATGLSGFQHEQCTRREFVKCLRLHGQSPRCDAAPKLTV